MWVSEGLQVQFPLARFVTCDKDEVTQSRTAHSCERWLQVRLESTEVLNNKSSLKNAVFEMIG